MTSLDVSNRHSYENTDDSRSLTVFRRISLIALIAGVIGAFVLLLLSRENAPIFLVVLFVIWVLGPFAFLAIAYRFENRWLSAKRTALYAATVAISIASLAIYGYVNVLPPQSTRAFVWVLVPPVSVLLSVAAVGIAALTGGSKSK
jgi:predicted membrane channel-forming protein YqfA (hemolysin III family)